MFKNDEQLYKTIGKNLKEKRNKKNITQLQLSDMSGVSLSLISKLESQKCLKSVSISTLNILANELGIELASLMEE